VNDCFHRSIILISPRLTPRPSELTHNGNKGISVLESMPSSNAFTKIVVCLSVVAACSGLLQPNPANQQAKTSGSIGAFSRREVFNAGLAGIVVLGTAEPALAFDNKISTKYDDRPKQRGSKVGNCDLRDL
jgi:hypothetical protein